jgi:hypothetical protein
VIADQVVAPFDAQGAAQLRRLARAPKLSGAQIAVLIKNGHAIAAELGVDVPGLQESPPAAPDASDVPPPPAPPVDDIDLF